MGNRLHGKVAVVTGGASGMGLATVRRFVDEGAHVVLADLNEANGATALEALQGAGHGDRVRFLRVDVAVESEIEGLVAHAVDSFGRLDVMFNNAGIGGAFGSITELHLEDWEYTFSVLVHGVFLGIKHSARQMIAQGEGGSILNTGSVAGVLGGGGPLCYSVAKAGVNHLTRTAALELAPHRIRVNNILPGPIKTPLMLGARPEATSARMLEYVPLGRLGEPEDIAAAALFYASDDSGFVTGDSMLVDGGLVAAAPGMVTGHVLEEAPSGITGAHHGTTGRKPTIRRD